MEDADDLVQEATLKAHDKLDTFRGESSFKTWLHAIATRLALTHLEGRRRWPSTAQLSMHEKADATPAFLADLGAAVNGPDFQYDVAEHVAYCFACVGRSLEPETSAALLLVEVFDFKNMEAASILGLSESTLRHRLAAARAHMETTFDGLCALVNKGGACHQCATLRGMCPPGR
jgi:RNA polymerase sigma-70 factor, ECF subfamily